MKTILDESQALSFIESTFLGYVAVYAYLSTLTLVLYDAIINMDREVKLIWKSGPKFQFIKIVYAVSRYFLIPCCVFCVATHSTLPHCNIYLRSAMVIITLTRAAGIYAFALRTYAICGKNKYILVVLLVLGATTFGYNLGQNIVITCASVSPANSPFWIGSSNGSLTCMDVLIAVLTIRYLWHTARSADEAFKEKGLSGVLLQQGLFYIFSVTLLQVLVLVLNFVQQSEGANILSPLSLPLSSLMVTRFILDLKETDSDLSRTGRDSSNMSSFIAADWEGIRSNIMSQSDHSKLPAVEMSVGGDGELV